MFENKDQLFKNSMFWPFHANIMYVQYVTYFTLTVLTLLLVSQLTYPEVDYFAVAEASSAHGGWNLGINVVLVLAAVGMFRAVYFPLDRHECKLLTLQLMVFRGQRFVPQKYKLF